MNARHPILRVLSMTLLAAALSAPAAATEVPDLYQQSYALETAYNYDRALKQLDGIALQGADAYLVPLRQGWLLYLLGRYDDSVAAYRKAMAADKSGVEARLGVTLPLMALRRWSEAEAECKEVLKIAPGNYLAMSRMAYVLYNSGRHAEAEAAYAALIKLYPSDVEMRTGLGWAQIKQGKTAEAKKNLEYVLHLVPDHASAKEGLEAL
ncbi:MAG: tetratricopeptide repeat protein [Alphaproteobacteria bacterium]|nr:tetratricopeptide repeat protein [Alphaproteobacteria bacterium]